MPLSSHAARAGAATAIEMSDIQAPAELARCVTLPAVATLLDDGSWEVQGRRLTLPVRITDASAALATYLVRTSAASRLVEGTGLSLVSMAGPHAAGSGVHHLPGR